eukprot:5442813-Pyramimonas_sp.AAC.2
MDYVNSPPPSQAALERDVCKRGALLLRPLLLWRKACLAETPPAERAVCRWPILYVQAIVYPPETELQINDYQHDYFEDLQATLIMTIKKINATLTLNLNA